MLVRVVWLVAAAGFIFLPVILLAMKAAGAPAGARAPVALAFLLLTALLGAAIIGRAVVQWFASPRRSDGPEAGYHDPPDTH